MNDLNIAYARLLHFGLLIVRQALDEGDLGWAQAEVTMLHNVPSLIEEPNVERHRYFWEQERTAYVDWASSVGRERAASRMRTYYKPIWDEMSVAMRVLLSAPDRV